MTWLRLAGRPTLWLLAVAAIFMCSKELYQAGYAARSAEVDVATRALNDRLAARDQEIADMAAMLAVARERAETLRQELDDAARQDPDADRPAFSPGSVQRLNATR